MLRLRPTSFKANFFFFTFEIVLNLEFSWLCIFFCRSLVKKNPMYLCICFDSEELDKFMESQGASAPGILTLTTSLSKPFMRLDKYPTLLQELERHVEVLEKWNIMSFFVYILQYLPFFPVWGNMGSDLCVFMSTPGSPSRLFWHFKGNSCLQEPRGKSRRKPPHVFVGSPFV